MTLQRFTGSLSHSSAPPLPRSSAPHAGVASACLAASTGVLITLSHPPAGWGVVAWVALLPLLLALDGQPGMQRILLGGLAGMVCSWGVAGYWLLFAFHQVPLGFLSAALLTQVSIFISGVLGLATFAWVYGARTPRLPSVVWVPASWVAIEYVRANIIAGSPWCLLGHSQHAFPVVIQIANLTGVYGVSFVVCAASVALASWWRGAADRRTNLCIATALVVGSLVYGAARLRQSDAAAHAISIQAAHPAWPPGLGELPEQRLADLIRISAQAPHDASALLVWPENALRFHLQDDDDLSAAFIAFVQDRQQYTIAGMHRYERDRDTTRYYNSAVLVAAEGSIVGVADKRMLVPVAESRWPLLPSVEQPFSAGKPWVPLLAGKRKIGVLMCFESIFPEPARLLVRQGASVLVNPTNDEILGDGAMQLAAMAVFRSVENGVPLVHVGTAGVTQIVDARGRIVAAESRAPRVVTATVTAGGRGTWYTRIGDAFALACGVLLAITVAGTSRSASSD